MSRVEASDDTVRLRISPEPELTTRPALGLGLVLVVLGYVVQWQHNLIEWGPGPAPVGWWFGGAVAGLLGVPLFFLAAGTCLAARPRPAAFVWYVLALAACAVLLWRFGAVYGLFPVRDLPELARQVLLPPIGLAPAYGLAVFPLLTRLTTRVSTPVLLAGALAVTVLVSVAATRVPELATTAALLRCLLFFLAGHRLGARTALTRLRPARTAVSRVLAEIGRSAVPTAAILVPFTAVTSAFLVKRFSVLDGSLQVPLALAGPVGLTVAVLVAGTVLRRLTGLLPGRVRR